MKQILTTLLLLFSLTLFAQTTVVTGPKKKQQTTAVDANKRKAEAEAAAKKRAAEETAAAKKKAEQAAASKKAEQTRQEKLRKDREEQARQEQLRREQAQREEQTRQEQARQEQLRREQAERERIEQEKRNALRWDESQKALCFNGMTYKMVYVQGGTFKMGATSEQGKDVWKDEKPTHAVTVNSYYIGQTEVTQALWQAVMGTNPSVLNGTTLPVENVSWNDCQTFIEKLNSMTGRTFRLPTEAEWEFASRGGNNSRGYKYSGSNYIDNVAWYTNNSNSKTHAVATKQANELGIYDMSGNVSEWSSDWYDSNYYKNSDSNNPRGAYTGSNRVYRGGDWLSSAGACRVSIRYYVTPDYRNRYLGLRLVLVP
ncbi:MAG: SUMF1/EgtB/PvdO family nonheme iron enzyme [Bacteroidaceae bacterium]|nr:SUMF1/EgtB/PvdO family nonheme iron enzyme [Bacteroidaceae bacterium]